ncbi:hypothetical protein CLAFUW4_07251 [Fulvia fulva]|nr:hypothetical protein CLAFUR4_07259 [Fulvia fulva]WPV16683.1 hypothetical protein CLAFUW4_07251 [Fulvia fulva]
MAPSTSHNSDNTTGAVIDSDATVNIDHVNTDGNAAQRLSKVVPPHLRSAEDKAAFRASLVSKDYEPISKTQKRLQDIYEKQRLSPFRPGVHKSTTPSAKQPTRGGGGGTCSTKLREGAHGSSQTIRGGSGGNKNTYGTVINQGDFNYASGSKSTNNIKVNKGDYTKPSAQNISHAQSAPQKKPTLNAHGKGKDNGNVSKQSAPRGKLSEEEKDRRRKEGHCFYCDSTEHELADCTRLKAQKNTILIKRPSAQGGVDSRSSSDPNGHTHTPDGGAAWLESEEGAKYAQKTRAWGDATKALVTQAEGPKTGAGYAERQQKLAEMKKSDKVEEPRQERITFRKTTVETVNGKLGGVRKAVKGQKYEAVVEVKEEL